MNTVFIFNDLATWDAQNDVGFIEFKTPADAKKAEELFTKAQREAWNDALELAAKVAERYEPTEKQEYISYASSAIRLAKK